jgi:outer membrane protein assembly factor BamB
MTKPRRRFPPLWLWILWALPAALIAFLWIGDPLGDEGMRNAISALLVLLIAALGYLWFVFRSEYAGKLRALIGLGTIALIVGCNALFEVRGFSGAMIPEFSLRLSEPKSLPVPAVEATSGVDLLTTSSADFPGFLGQRRDGTVRVLLAADWDTRPPERVWQADVGAGWSGFAVVNGIAVTMEQRGDEEAVTAYDVTTGELLWAHAYPGHFEHILGGEGPRATPTVDEGRVYTLGAFGRLLCLDGATGALIWERDLLAEFGITPAIDATNLQNGRSNSPLIVGELVVIPGGGDANARMAGLVAYDKRTGELAWEGPPRQISFGSPNVATLAGVEQILIVNESTVSGHAPATGELLWEHDWPGRSNQDANCSQAVPLEPKRVFVSKGYGGGSMLLELTAKDDGTFEAQPVWRSRRSMRTKFTNVVVKDAYVYGLSDGMLECIELETGKRVWKDGRYGHGQILLAGEQLIVLTEEGGVLLVEATPEKENSVLGRFQGLEGKTWNNPALYAGLLVMRNGQEAAAYRLPLSGE